jgi:hypothetical protein
MSELRKRQSLRSHAKRPVVVANHQQNLASSIPFAADSPRSACIKARELNNKMVSNYICVSYQQNGVPGPLKIRVIGC